MRDGGVQACLALGDLIDEAHGKGIGLWEMKGACRQLVPAGPERRAPSRTVRRRRLCVVLLALGLAGELHGCRKHSNAE